VLEPSVNTTSVASKSGTYSEEDWWPPKPSNCSGAVTGLLKQSNGLLAKSNPAINDGNRPPLRRGGLRARYWTADFRGRLVFPQPLVDHLSQQVIVCPTEILDLDDKLGSHPINLGAFRSFRGC
jgi:hypothetical protein